MVERQTPSTTDITLFGTVSICHNDQTHVVTSKPLSALLGYLALNATEGRVVTRAMVADKLWPMLTESRGRQALNDTLYRLKQHLGNTDAWLFTDATTLYLKHVTTDVASFRLLASGIESASWQTAANLYAGDLLTDVDAEWVLVPRTSLQDIYIHLLGRICAALLGTGQLIEALGYAQRWVQGDMFNEHAHRALISLYARLGRYTTALQQYDQLVSLLEEELQTAPLPDTRALAKAIRAEYQTLPVPHATARPFVGRGEACAQVFAALEEAQHGRGGMITLEGEPGIGKTRLLEVIADSANWRGMRVVRVAATTDTWRPQSAPFDDALRLAAAGLVADQVYPHLTAQAAHLLMELTDSERMHERELGATTYASSKPKQPAPQVQELSQPYTPAEYANIVGALSDTAPYVLLFDDMHWATDCCWAILEACAAHIAHQRVLVVLSYRGDALRARPLAWRALRNLELATTAQHINLRGLSQQDCATLVRTQGHKLDTSAQQLYQRTGGNPLFVLELLAAGLDTPMPETLSAVLESRLAQLTSAARLALEAAAVLGYEVSYSAWSTLVGSEVRAIAFVLVGQQFLEELTRSYRFRHGVLREYIYASLSQERRCLLHHRAATLLRSNAAASAWHYAQAEIWEQAIAMYQAAGEQAIAVHDSIAARTYYEHAITLAAQTLQQHGEQHTVSGSWEQVAQLEQRWRTIHPTPPPVTVRLARAAAPLGRPITDIDQVTVEWTVDAGELDAAILRSAGKVAQRRQRIVRLINEAQQQGALPTDQNLAHVLHVTKRTISDDITAICATGLHIETRGRRAAML